MKSVMERRPEQASADNLKMEEGLTVIRGMLTEDLVTAVRSPREFVHTRQSV